MLTNSVPCPCDRHGEQGDNGESAARVPPREPEGIHGGPGHHRWHGREGVLPGSALRCTPLHTLSTTLPRCSRCPFLARVVTIGTPLCMERV